MTEKKPKNDDLKSAPSQNNVPNRVINEGVLPSAKVLEKIKPKSKKSKKK